jgi:hypothetical protein
METENRDSEHSFSSSWLSWGVVLSSLNASFSFGSKSSWVFLFIHWDWSSFSILN